MTVSLHEEDTRDVIRACLDERADVGVGVESPVPSGLDAWHFAQDPLQVVMPAGHALARQASIGFSQALQHPLIGVNQGGALDRSLTERAEALRLRFAPAVSVSSFDAVCRMVEAGLGIAVIPSSAAAAYAGSAQFVRRPLSERWAARNLHVYALRRSPQTRVTQALLEHLRG